MKKILCILAVLCCVVGLTACGGKKNEIDFNEHLIEIRNNIFAGQDESFYATVCTGEREQDYALDGVINELVPFGIVTMSRFDNERLNADSYPFTLVINGESVNGSLEKSPYDNTYSADIEQVIADDAEVVLQVVVDGVSFNQTLSNISKDFAVSKQDAINLACETLKSSIKNLSREEGSYSEGFVKILKDYSGETDKYYWYIGIISPDGQTSGVLIDASTGSVVSKKL